MKLAGMRGMGMNYNSLTLYEKDRLTAKFYGGKALKGKTKEKSFAEALRKKVIESGFLSEEEVKNLLKIGGIVDTTKFWIENISVHPSKFIAENIAKQYNGLVEIKRKHYKTLATTNYLDVKKTASLEIKNYMKTCDFNFCIEDLYLKY